MIKEKNARKKRVFGGNGSLYLGLLKNIVIGMVAAVLAFFIVRVVSYYYINTRYLSDENRQKRRAEYLQSLQNYAEAENISSDDTEKLAAWSREHPYVYLLIYKDDLLFFTSDMEPEKPSTDKGEDKDEESGNKDEPGDGGDENEAPGDDEEGKTDGKDEEKGEDSDTAQDGEEKEPGEDNEEKPDEPSDDNEPDEPTDKNETDEPSEGDAESEPSDGENTEEDDGENKDDTPTDDKPDSEDKKPDSEDKKPDSTDKKPSSGITLGALGLGSFEENRKNREELIAEARANGFYPIELDDGTLMAALTDHSQELYFSIADAASFALAVISLAVILLVYMGKIIAKIKRLETDVTVVSGYDMNHRIVCEGNDEITRLSRNVENMRNSMVDNLRREREARAANTELVTSISHDIRTPLTVLLGYIDMMKSRAEGDEVMGAYIAASESTAMRLKTLSDDMFKYALTFGETEKGITLEEYDAATLLAQLLEEHIVLLSESGYTVDMSLADGGAFSEGEKIVTDAQNLMRIVDNVFSNIYKYADKDSPIGISTEKNRSSVRLIFKNRVAENTEGAESNRIGLKTCARLASFVAGGFDASGDGEFFTVSIDLKLKK